MSSCQSILQALRSAYGKDAFWLPDEVGYRYLRGYTKLSRRGICLIYDEKGSVITKEIVLAAYREVKEAGLVLPFLFFGGSKLYGDDAFIFMQVRFLDHQVIFPRVLYRT